MIDRVVLAIEKYNMLNKGDGIVVGLSGGPDSVCLLHVLYTLKERYNLSLYAVHINHMIRGEEALRDEHFAKTFAEKLGIPFYSKRIKVEEYAKENNISVEEAGRFIRYSFFDEIAIENQAKKIALAHNMNDQAETMLMYFMRGSGISGLSGIKPMRENKYIRPIIGIKRNEIEEYCNINKLIPVIDSTNLKTIYTRNRVRLELIPYIEKYFNKNIIEGLYKASEIFREEDEFLNGITKATIETLENKDGFDVVKFNNLDIAVKRRVLRKLILEVKGNLKDIEQKHIEDCIYLINNKQTGRRIDLPSSIVCVIEYDIFKFKKNQKDLDFEYKLIINGTVKCEELLLEVTTKLYKNERKENFNDNIFIKYYDYDRIGCDLQFRNRRKGDYINPKGMQGKKKLKDLFIDRKITRENRALIPLITIGDEVVWAVGIRDTRSYKIDENTKNIIEVKVIKVGEENAK